jgi:hypothetical protein
MCISWSLQTRSECRASRIAGPIGVVRERVRRAAIKLIDCKPGSPALEIALADCTKACRRLSEVIQKAGGPTDLVNLVLQPPVVPADMTVTSQSLPSELAVNPTRAEVASPRPAILFARAFRVLRPRIMAPISRRRAVACGSEPGECKANAIANTLDKPIDSVGCERTAPLGRKDEAAVREFRARYGDGFEANHFASRYRRQARSVRRAVSAVRSGAA